MPVCARFHICTASTQHPTLRLLLLLHIPCCTGVHFARKMRLIMIRACLRRSWSPLWARGSSRQTWTRGECGGVQSCLPSTSECQEELQAEGGSSLWLTEAAAAAAAAASPTRLILLTIGSTTVTHQAVQLLPSLPCTTLHLCCTAQGVL